MAEGMAPGYVCYQPTPCGLWACKTIEHSYLYVPGNYDNRDLLGKLAWWHNHIWSDEATWLWAAALWFTFFDDGDSVIRNDHNIYITHLANVRAAHLSRTLSSANMESLFGFRVRLFLDISMVTPLIVYGVHRRAAIRAHSSPNPGRLRAACDIRPSYRTALALSAHQRLTAASLRSYVILWNDAAAPARSAADCPQAKACYGGRGQSCACAPQANLADA